MMHYSVHLIGKQNIKFHLSVSFLGVKFELFIATGL